jgi:exonuclease SbcD
MIRILHTADWHLGHTLRGYTREIEHESVLEQIVTIIVESHIDVLIVAGDIHDTQNPSGEVLQGFYRSISRIRRAQPRITIIITAGNHDAPSRLEAPGALLSALNMHVIGSVRRKDGKALAERHLVPVHDSKGNHALNVLAVSHPTAGCLANLTRLQDEGGSLVARKVGELYEELYEQLRARLDDLPLIVTGHLHVMGGEISKSSERRILCGGEHAVPPTVFPESACYVALGHLHKAQSVGKKTIRYSGSLFPMSASETDYRHSVTVVTVDDSGEVTVEPVPLERPVPFLRVPEKGVLNLSEVPVYLSSLLLQADLPIDRRPFVQAVLFRETLPVSFREELDMLMHSFPIRMLDPAVISPADVQSVGTESVEEFRNLSEQKPDDLFSLAFEQHHHREPTKQHLDNFHWLETRIGIEL